MSPFTMPPVKPDFSKIKSQFYWEDLYKNLKLFLVSCRSVSPDLPPVLIHVTLPFPGRAGPPASRWTLIPFCCSWSGVWCLISKNESSQGPGLNPQFSVWIGVWIFQPIFKGDLKTLSHAGTLCLSAGHWSSAHHSQCLSTVCWVNISIPQQWTHAGLPTTPRWQHRQLMDPSQALIVYQRSTKLRLRWL